jgi:hypothetical protein
MANFCSACGSPVNEESGFCGGCGARTTAPAQTPTPVQTTVVQPAAPVSSSGSSFLKIALVLVACLFVFGAVAVGSLYYYAHRLVKNVESATGVSVDDVTSSIRAAAKNQRNNGGSDIKRDGCALISKEDVQDILGVQLERVDGTVSSSTSYAEHCDYFVKEESPEESVAKIKAAAAEVQSRKDASPVDESQPQSERTRKDGTEKMLKSMLHAAAGGAGGSDAPYFHFVVDREQGKMQFGVFKATNALTGMDQIRATESLNGLGDKAILGPMDSSLCVLSGNVSVVLYLEQVPDGKAKGIALARKILSRI